MLSTTRPSIASALLLLGALSSGCGDEGGEPNEVDNGAATAGATYTATLVPITAENASLFIAVPHKVSLLDDRGEQLDPPVTTTSGTDGKVTILNRPEEAASVYVEGVGPADVNESTYDTIQLNHNWDSGETLLRISNRGTVSFAEASAGFTASPDRAAVSGAVYWTTDGKARVGAVGCAKIFIDGQTAPDDDQAQRYIGSTGLPATLSSQSSTVKGSGRFYVGNMKVGEHTLKVSLDDGQTFSAEKTFYIGKTRAQAASPTKSIIYQIGIDTVFATNPTPATCL